MTTGEAVVGACLSVVTLALYVLLAVKPVTIAIAPHVAFAPAFVRVNVRVQPNAENRGLTVEADGEAYRSSYFSMEGENAPLRFQVEWPSLPAGEYDVRAVVSDSVQHVIARDVTTLKVIGRE